MAVLRKRILSTKMLTLRDKQRRFLKEKCLKKTLEKFVTLLLALEYGRTQMTKNILFEEDSASYETNTNRLGS